MARRVQPVILNEQGTPQENLTYYLIGFFGTLYFAILCGAAWTPGCNFGEWMNAFTQFIIVEKHFIVGFTAGTGYFIAVFEAVWTLGYLYYITKIKHPYRGQEHGRAKWGSAKEFTKDYGNHEKKNLVKVNFGNCAEPKQPVYVNTHNYWLAEGVYVNIDNKLTSNLNILVVGPPGTGKSFRLARPVLSQLAGNFLVTDPKGELSKQCGQFFEDNGYEVLVLNIESEESMANSIHFNPFRYLRNESDIMSLAQILFKATTDPEENNSGDVFFEKSAETLLTDILYLMHYTYPQAKKDWKHFVQLLESTIVKANEQTGGIDNSDPNGILGRFESANTKWREGAFTDGVPQEEDLKGLVDIRKYYHGAQETTSSIVASLDAHCRYMKLQCVKELLSEDDIQIRDTFGYCKKSKASPTGKRVLFIVTSEDKRYYDWITSMVYSLFFDELYHLTAIDPSLHDTLPEHLTFLMDEFANVTLPDSFVEKLSTMRSRGMSAIVIIQNLVQLKRKFPKFDMDKDLIANMSIIDILGAPDQDSCEYLSKSFGTMTIHKQTTGLTRGTQGSFSENEDVMQKPLFSPEDMYGMNKDGPCAMVIKGTDPLFQQKCAFERSPLLPLLTRREPYRVRKRVSVAAEKYDATRSPCDQIPEFFVGAEAKQYLEKCKEEGIRVIKLTEDDIDALSILERSGKEIPGKDAATKEFWRNVHRSTAKALKERGGQALDLDEYEDDQLITVQRLRNNGFSPNQIHAMDCLIHAGSDFEEITTYFGNQMSVSDIADFAKRLADVKQRTKKKAELI